MNSLLVTRTNKSIKWLAVNQLLLYAGLVMALTLPYFISTNLIQIDQFLAIAIIAGLSILAGFYSRIQPLIVGLNIIVCLFAIFVFELASITSYQSNHLEFFLVNTLLAALFYIALYANAKAFYTYYSNQRTYLSK